MKLVIIDASVIVFQIVSALESRFGAQASSSVDARIYAESAIDFINQNGWLPGLHGQKCKVIWVCDRKPYWRSMLHPEYKAHRKSKPESFDMVMRTLEKANISAIGFPGYEADDVAAAIIRLWLASRNNLISQIYLATVDSDWCGLVLDPNIFWCNTRDYQPRLRTRTEIYQWLCSKWNKQSKKKQRLWLLPSFPDFTCSNIWDWKVATGDKADNLDADSARHLIDLIHPPRSYDLLDRPDSVQCIHQAIHKASFSSLYGWKEAQQIMFALGMLQPLETLLIPADIANRQLIA